jgi:hypothetical protein
MAEGAWEQTATLQCTFANIFGDGKKRYHPDDFNPYKKKRQTAIPLGDEDGLPMSSIKDFWCSQSIKA